MTNLSTLPMAHALPLWMRRLSGIFALICLFIALYSLLNGLVLSGMFLFAPDTVVHGFQNAPIRFEQRLLIGPTTALPGLMAAWSLMRARRCFKGLAQNEV